MIKVGDYITIRNQSQNGWRSRYAAPGEHLKVTEVDRNDVYVYCKSTNKIMFISDMFYNKVKHKNLIGGKLL